MQRMKMSYAGYFTIICSLYMKKIVSSQEKTEKFYDRNTIDEFNITTSKLQGRVVTSKYYCNIIQFTPGESNSNKTITT
jgi:hypothetical protein